MNRSVAAAVDGIRPDRRFSIDFAILIGAWLILAFGTFATLASSEWLSGDDSYGPLVLAVAVFMAVVIYRRGTSEPQPSNAGLAILGAALVAFLLGVIVNNLFLRSGGLWAAAVGLVVAMAGWQRLRTNAYPFIVGLCALPLPGALTIALTFPIKMTVSAAVTSILWRLGYPIANTGVVIQIGAYRLLVADACSGLQSMYSLFATAVFFLFVTNERSPIKAAAMLIVTAPIILLLNIWRVVTLALITYYWGDAAGRSFLHGAAGIAMFLLAFLCFYLIDLVLRKISR